MRDLAGLCGICGMPTHTTLTRVHNVAGSPPVAAPMEVGDERGVEYCGEIGRIYLTFDMYSPIRLAWAHRRETGSLGTAPTATQSGRCSHSGIARSSFPLFSLFLGRLHRSREGCQGSETRPGRGGSRCPGDRLASPVPWSGVGESLAPPRGRRTSDRASARPNTVPLPVRRCADGSRIPLDPSYVPEYPGSKLLIAGHAHGPAAPRTKKRIRDMPGYTGICRDIVGCAPGVSGT